MSGWNAPSRDTPACDKEMSESDAAMVDECIISVFRYYMWNEKDEDSSEWRYRIIIYCPCATIPPSCLLVSLWYEIRFRLASTTQSVQR